MKIEYEEIYHHNIISIGVGTTCPIGDDSKYGGKTVFILENLGCTNMKVNIIKDMYGDDKTVVIEFLGEAEYLTFIEALEFAVETLKKQYLDNRPHIPNAETKEVLEKSIKGEDLINVKDIEGLKRELE